jgi:hypothetical protein
LQLRRYDFFKKKENNRKKDLHLNISSKSIHAKEVNQVEREAMTANLTAKNAAVFATFHMR